MVAGRRAGGMLLVLVLAAACAAPPSPSPDTATPNGVQTAQALLTLSFAPIIPTVSDTPAPGDTPAPSPTLGIPTATASPTVSPSDTAIPTASATASAAALPSATAPITATRLAPGTATTNHAPRTTATLTATASLRVTATVTLTPTAAPRIVPSNAVSLTQSAVLAQVVISGGPPPRLDQAAWSPDGQLAVVGAPGLLFAQGDMLIAASALTATRGYTMGVWVPSLSFSTDNRALALSSVGGTVRLFNRANGALLFQLVQPNLSVPQVRYRPGPPGVLAQYLASLAGDNLIYVFDVAYRKYLGMLNPGPGGAAALEISGDGQWLAAASGNDVVLWDMTTLPATGWTGPLPPTLRLTQEAAVTGLALSQDGLFLAASNAGGTIEWWTVAAGQRLAVFPRLLALPERLTFSPDGQLVAAAYSDHALRVWGLASPAAPLAALAGHTDRITSLAFSPDGRALASSSWDGTVREWTVGGEP